MKLRSLESLALRSTSSNLLLLDQTLLPQEQSWIEIKTVNEMISAIQKLQVRGAPLIAIAAALSFAHALKNGLDQKLWVQEITKLRNSRPTAVNLMNAMDIISNRVREGANAEELIQLCESFFVDDVSLCDRLAKQAASEISLHDNILTHCNTGGLATAGAGTALAGIIQAHRENKNIHVWVDETRPLLQGGRLTSWELSRAEVPFHLICDNMAAHLMGLGKVQKVLVGADRIAVNGDFANKIGTYSLAVNAHFHRIPFFVVAPKTTVDRRCLSGGSIPIEERSGDEIIGVRGSFGDVKWAPLKVPTYNPAFDVTPHDLVTGWIFEDGILNLAQVKAGALKGSES